MGDDGSIKTEFYLNKICFEISLCDDCILIIRHQGKTAVEIESKNKKNLENKFIELGLQGEWPFINKILSGLIPPQ